MKSKKPVQKKYVKAQTPAMLQKQRAAIISYYTKKRKENEPKKNVKSYIPSNT